MRDDLRRAYEFLERGDLGTPYAEPTQFGTLHSDPAFPLRRDSNYLAVDALPPEIGADELEADAERAQRAAGFGDRSIFLRDEHTGERLAPAFAARGWEVRRFVVMAHRRPPEKAVDTSLASEVDEGTLRPARERNMPPWGTLEVRRQLLDARVAIARRVTTRFFAVLVGSDVASYADLYQDGADAQVEDVATLEPYRGRGYASAVVLRAVEEARRAGAELVFLVADAEDWPKQLYRRLGFDEIGRYLKFARATSDPPARIPPESPAPETSRPS